MAIWLFRAGRTGQFETKCINDKRIYLTWSNLDTDLSKFHEKIDLYNYLKDTYSESDTKIGRIRNWTGQIWPIAHTMNIDDWIILPSKSKSSIHIGRITGEYCYKPTNDDPFLHFRDVDWFAPDIPRSNFDQDLLYSFGAFMTVCRISRNNAEQRIKDMSKNSWKSTYSGIKSVQIENVDDESTLNEIIDIEEFSYDSIAKYLIRKYKGHNMARIIDAILHAKGYTTYISPEGPDKGIDILAAPGQLGFGNPRICVQIKTNEQPIDRPTLDQLIGTMNNVQADQGLLISWSGFKSSVTKEIPIQFFRVRLWDQGDIIRELMNVYEDLDEDIKSEIPLKKIWTLAEIDEG